MHKESKDEGNKRNILPVEWHAQLSNLASG